MMTRDELKSALVKADNGVNVTFVKSDETERTMKSTLNAKYLPVPTEAVKEKKERKKSEDPDLFVVWDMEKEAWRSFKFSAVKDVQIV
jgi:hypothetical protein